jgi:hypothetical protein
MICGVTVKTAIMKLRAWNVARSLVIARPIDSVAASRIRRRTSDRRRTRSPSGEMKRMPTAYLKDNGERINIIPCAEEYERELLKLLTQLE